MNHENTSLKSSHANKRWHAARLWCMGSPTVGRWIGLAMCGGGILVASAQTSDDFNVSVNGSVRCLAVQPDGKIIVGGKFTTLGGESRINLGRLLPDGSVDATFHPTTAGDAAANYYYAGTVETLLVQPDGKILVSGFFTNLAGQARNSFGRLNLDGSLDEGFDAVVSGSWGGEVDAMALQPDGKILIGGSFETVNGVARTNLARLNHDGTLDASFAGEVLTNSWGDAVPVNGLAVQPDGRILISGGYSYSGSISRLLSNGAIDSGFGLQFLDFGPSSMTLTPEDGVLVGGELYYPGSYDGSEFMTIAKFNTDGSDDSSFSFPRLQWFNEGPRLSLQADGRIIVAGDTGVWAGPGRLGDVGRIFQDGTFDLSFYPLPGRSWVASLAGLADGKVLVAANTGLLRLTNTEPAVQSLELGGSTLTWQRSGTSPEVWRTTFEVSTNGSDWMMLGAGTRAVGGWGLTGVNLPAGACVRARGFLTGSQNSGWFIETGLGAPFLNGQPDSQTRNVGEAARLFVSAAGSGPFSYQWFKDGVGLSDGGDVSGVGTSRLVVSNLLEAAEGGYSVVVSSSSGSVTSQIAQLTVVDPYIVTHPANQDVEEGGTATFAVGVVGTGPWSYQWYHDETLLPGATNASISIGNAGRAEIGGYYAVVANAHDRATSHVALLSVNLIHADALDAFVNSFVYSLAEQSDGKILLAGQFGSLGGQPRNRVGRLNPDGGSDLGFDPEANSLGTIWRGRATSIAIQPDQRIVVGGDDSSSSLFGPTNLVRLNPDGTADSFFQFNSGVDKGTASRVNSLTLQPDGAILAGGRFLLFDDLYLGAVNCCRVLPDGTPDPLFGVNWSPFEDIFGLALQSDDKVLVGGSSLTGPQYSVFTRVGTTGLLDSGFVAEIGAFYHDPAYPVYCVVVQPDGKILVGGRFIRANGQNRKALVRLNPDGTLDPTFNVVVARTNITLEPSVYSMALQADGRILVGGVFNSLDGHPRDFLGRLNPDGSVDSSFNPGANAAVYALALQSDGRVLVGGGFTNIAGQNRRYFARLNNTEPAVQTLTASSSMVTWLRGGTAPDAWRTTFEYSTNGTDWLDLGAGERIVGGWVLVGVNLPASATVRARGYTSGGRYNGSTWFVESQATVNQSPLADASATRTLWISPNNTSATVVLDGTRASDPDGDLLGYLWHEAGDDQPFATGAVAVVTLPVGAHELELRVSDGLAGSSDSLTVEVITALQTVELLLSSVRDADLRHARSLEATLLAARHSLRCGRSTSAIHQLEAFQQQLCAQVKRRQPELAEQWMAQAQAIIDALSDPDRDRCDRPPLRCGLKREHGKVRICFDGTPGRVHIIEASTNLVYWEMISVARAGADGVCEVEDPHSGKFPQRYYRVVSP